MVAVIQAGGKGTRLREITGDRIPKSLVLVNEKPILEIQVEKLSGQGIKEIFIIIGHLGEQIERYFGDGSKWGVRINYIKEKESLGSAGALYYLKERIKEDFFLIFSDLVFDVDFKRMISFHRRKGSIATLLVHPNSHPYDSDLILMDDNDWITGFDSKKNVRDYWYDNCVNSGIYLLSEAILQCIDSPCKMDMEQDLLFPLIQEQAAVFGYRSSEYVKDVGTPERLCMVIEDIARGIPEKRNLKEKQRCIFLDRDGTVNRYAGLLYDEESFALEDFVCSAIKLINHSGYLAIIITNQPVVARGLCKIEMVRKIHNKMATLLGKKGVFVDDIIFCPHHPDKGFPEENPEYKIVCNCRKPQTGMIDTMVKKYNIDVSKSYIVGDTTTDTQTGMNAGLSTVLVRTGEAGRDGKYCVMPDHEAVNLLDAVTWILQREKE